MPKSPPNYVLRTVNSAVIQPIPVRHRKRQIRQLITICKQLKEGDKKKNQKGSLVRLADLEVWVLFAEDVGDPKATDIVGQSLCTHESKPILLGYVAKFNRCTHIFVLSITS